MPSMDDRRCGMLGLCVIGCPMSNRLDQMANLLCAKQPDLSIGEDEPLEVVLAPDDENAPGQEGQEQGRI